jgi:hypothetical protein
MQTASSASPQPTCCIALPLGPLDMSVGYMSAGYVRWVGVWARARQGERNGFLPDAAFWGAVAQAIPSFADRPGAPGFLPDLVDMVGAALTSLQWGCVAVSSEV